MGVEIDWSKAPEGATHWAPENDDYVEAFYRPDGEAWRFSAEHTGWDWSRAVSPARERLLQFVARPGPVQPWNGEGLPPAGTVCEVLNNTLDRPEWERCTVLFMGKFKAVYESESCHERVADVSDDWMISFRPLRTPKQIAAEERREAIDQMVQFFMNYYGNPKGAEQYLLICRSLYDAGYRKVTP